MDALAQFKAREHVLIVDGIPFKGQLGTNIVTDPVVPIEQVFFGPLDGVTVTTTYSLIPDEGDPFPIEIATIDATTGIDGSRMEITTKPTGD